MNLMTLFPARRRQQSQRRAGRALTSIKETLMVGVGTIQLVSGEYARHRNLAGCLIGRPVAAATPLLFSAQHIRILAGGFMGICGFEGAGCRARYKKIIKCLTFAWRACMHACVCPCKLVKQ